MYLHLYFRSKSPQYFFILSNSNLQLFILLYLYAKSFASILLFCIPKIIDISLEEKLSNSTSISRATHGDFPSELLLFKFILFNPSGFSNPPLPKKNFLSPVYDFISSLLDINANSPANSLLYIFLAYIILLFFSYSKSIYSFDNNSSSPNVGFI